MRSVISERWNFLCSCRAFINKLLCLAALLAGPLLTRAQKQDTVVVLGSPATFSKIVNAVRIKGYTFLRINEDKVRALSPEHFPLLILAAEKAVSATTQLAVDRYLRSGGDAMVLGVNSSKVKSKPVAVKGLGDFRDENTYTITMRETGPAEKPAVSHSIDQYGNPALRFQTFKRGINDVRVTFDCAGIASTDRNLLQINAKGDAYMDLLYIEATDNKGRSYCTFLPLEAAWKAYTVPLENLISVTTEDPEDPWLRPQDVRSISIGTHRKTLWPEKPMTFSIGQVGLARNYSDTRGPTPAVNRLTVPFMEVGLPPPPHVFGPFYGAKQVFAPELYIPENNAVQVTLERAWGCPPPFNDFPGIGMGTDHKEAFDTRDAHSVRCIPLLKAVGLEQPVAELRLYAGGLYKGSAVAIFGVDPVAVAGKPWFWKLFSETLQDILKKPQICRIEVKTTTGTAKSPAVPVLHLTLRNPQKKNIGVKINVRVGEGKKSTVKGNETVVLSPGPLSSYNVTLETVPEAFDFKQFNWAVALQSEYGLDIWRDSVDVERIVLQAGLHMIHAQRVFPDGRMSNHYFADAYGARALFSYSKYIEDHPERLHRNKAIWQQADPGQFKNCAEQFCDMLVRRQMPEGTVPMGYSEQSGSYNVADGGQISLGLAAVGLMEDDPLRRAQYMNASKKMIDYAESYYIDSGLFDQLVSNVPKKVKSNHTLPGFYGLGVYGGGVRKKYGPVWVLSDILTTQALLSFIYPKEHYLDILKRNVNTYLPNARVNSGWYQAEAMVWSWLAISDAKIRHSIEENLTNSFLPTLFTGKAGDMFDFGGRGSLRALPLLYYRRLFGDSPGLRAAVLKYVWTAGSESFSNSVAGLRKAYPVPHHGASLAAIKFSEFSSIWAMELLEPGATLIKKPRTNLGR